MTYQPPKTFKRADEHRAKPRTSGVKAWSVSLLKKFETCRYSVFLSHVRKLRVSAELIDMTAAERGISLHKCAEDFIQGKRDDFLPEFDNFADLLRELRAGFTAGTVTVEEKVGVTEKWEPTGFFADDVWLRLAIDALAFNDVPEKATEAEITDHKSGKKEGNQTDHVRQGLIYAICTFAKYPLLQKIKVRMAYLDQPANNNELIKTYTRKQVAVFIPGIERKGREITECADFFPSPAKYSCQYCNYSKDGSCDYAWTEEAAVELTLRSPW